MYLNHNYIYHLLTIGSWGQDMIQEMIVMSSLLTISSSHRQLEFLDGSCGLNRRWAPCAHASILLPLLRYILCLLFLIYCSSMVLSTSADMCVHIFTDVMFAVYEVAFLLKNGIACDVCSKEIFLFLFFYLLFIILFETGLFNFPEAI